MLFDEHLNIPGRKLEFQFCFPVSLTKCVSFDQSVHEMWLQISAFSLCVSVCLIGSPSPLGCTPAFALYFSALLARDDI